MTQTTNAGCEDLVECGGGRCCSLPFVKIATRPRGDEHDCR